MKPFLSVAWILFVVTIVGATLVHGDPEPMARPTRPKVFTSPEELRRYLDLVKDYYSLSGKARYGKRGDVAFSDLSHPWDALRLILDARRQMQQQQEQQQQQQQRQEKFRQEEKEQILQDLQSTDKHIARPSYLSDVMGKYYDDVQ